VLESDPSVIPVLIPVCHLASKTSLFGFIEKHTAVRVQESKMVVDPKFFVLIFDNLLPEHTAAVEFIRAITTTAQVPVFSQNDPKILELTRLRNFLVVVTSTTISRFSPRFLVRFTPIQLSSPTTSSVKHIFTVIANSFSINPSFAGPVFELLEDSPRVLSMLDILSLVPQRVCETDKDLDFMLRLFLFESDFLYRHTLSTEAEREEFLFNVLAKFDRDLAQRAVTDFKRRDLHFFPDVSYDATQARYRVKVVPQQENLLVEELAFHYAGFNRQVAEKVVLFFTPDTIWQYLLLNRALMYPGRSVIIKSAPSVGRRSLSRFIAHVRSYEFVDLLLPRDTSDAVGMLASLMEQIVLSKQSFLLYVRTSQFSPEVLGAVLYLMESSNFPLMLSQAQLDTIYVKLGKTVVDGADQQKLEHLNSLIDSFRRRVHFVFAVGPSFDEHNCPSAYFIRFDAAPPTFEQSARTILRDDTAIDLSSVFAKIHTQLVPPYCPVHQVIFYDLVDTFKRYVEAENATIISKHENSQEAFTFLTNSAQALQKVQGEIDQLAPQLQELVEKIQAMTANYDARNGALQARLDSFDERRKSFEAEIETHAAEEKKHEIAMGEEILVLRNAIDALNNIREEELALLQKRAYQAPPQLPPIISCFCIFLGMKPGWGECGRSFFTGADFIKRIGSIDHQTLRPVAVDKVSRILEAPHLEPSAVRGQSEVLFMIYSYLMTLTSYAGRAEKRRKAQVARERVEIELQKWEEDISFQMSSIAAVQNSLQMEWQQISAVEQKREDLDLTHSELCYRRSMLHRVLDGLDDFMETLRKSSGTLKTEQAMAWGNTVLFAVYLVYCGRLTSAQSSELLLAVQKELRSHKISVTSEDPLVFVTSQLSILEHSENQLKTDRFLSPDTENDVRRIRCGLRTPLIMDFDGFVTQDLRAGVKQSRLIECSLLDPDFDEILTNSVTKGKTLFIRDANFMTRALESVLLVQRVPDDRATLASVKIGDRTISKNRKFRLYLFTSARSIVDISPDLLLRVTLFETSPNPTVRTKLVSIFRDRFAPDVPFGTDAIQRLDVWVERLRLERDLIDLMSDIESVGRRDSKYDFIADNETRSDLFRLKDRYLQNLATKFDDIAVGSAEFEVFLPTVNLLGFLWEALTRYLPRIGTNIRYSFHDFTSAIQASVGQLVPEAEPDAIHRTVIGDALAFILPSLTHRDAIFALFIAAFLARCSDGRANTSDLPVIVKHCSTELVDICDTTMHSSDTGDPVDQLKFANVVTIFRSMQRVIDDSFGDALEAHFPIFRPENLILREPGEPLVVRTSSENYPLQMLANYAANENAIDRLVSISASDSVLSEIEKVRSSWIVVHYTDPSPAGAACLCRLRALCAKLDPETRLIIFVRSLAMLPEDFLTSRCLAVDDFPSMRIQMAQLCTQYQIPSRGHPVLMRKLAHMSAVLVGSLNFRRFVRPIGLCESPRVADLFYKDIMLFAKELLELKFKDLPLRNFTEAVAEIALGTFTCDSADADRILAQVERTLRPDLVKEGGESVQNLTNSTIGRPDLFPTFAAGDFLPMKEQYVVPLKDWSLSQYFGDCFRVFAGEKEFAVQEMLAALDKAFVSLPSTVVAPDGGRFNSPLRVFLFSEIEAFNLGLIEIRRQMMTQDLEILRILASDRTPVLWLELINFVGAISLTKFLSNLKDRAFTLRIWLKATASPSPINVRRFGNLRGLLEAFITEQALLQGIPAGDLALSAQIANEAVPRKERMILTGCWLMSGGVDVDANEITEGSAPFTTIPQLVLRAEPRQSITGLMPLPLFKSIPNRETALARDFERIDGEATNLIAELMMPVTIPEWSVKLNGTAIVCHMPECFG
jgi:hypothetical protein